MILSKRITTTRHVLVSKSGGGDAIFTDNLKSIFVILKQRDTRKTPYQGRIPNMMCFPDPCSTTQNKGFSSYLLR